MAYLNTKLADYIARLDVFKTAFFLLCLAGVLYLNAVYYPFLEDDRFLILQNPVVTGEEPWLSSFFSPSSLGRNVPGANQYYRPVVDLFSRLEYRLFGNDPSGYHLVNILLHAANSLLVYLIGFLLSGRKGFAFSMAVLFLSHPVQTEAVSCISGLSNLLFSFWCLAALYGFLISTRQSRRPWCWYGFSIIAFLLALFSKEQAFLFLGVVLLCGILDRRRNGSSDRTQNHWTKLLGFLIAGAGYLGIRGVILGQPSLSFLRYPEELWLRISAIPQTLLMYLRILVAPYDLHYYRSVDILDPVVLPAVVLGVLVLGVILFILRFVRLSEDRRLVIFGAGWFVILLVPLSALPLINEYSFVLAAEHFLYLPFAGFLLFVLTLIRRGIVSGFKGREPVAAAVLLAITVVVFGGLTIRQNAYWRADVALLKRTLQFEKDFGRGHLLLARSLLAEGQVNEAIAEYKIALDIMNRYYNKAAQSARGFYRYLIQFIYLDLGRCHEFKKQWGKAGDYYEKALILDPDFEPARDNLRRIQHDQLQGL